MTKTTIQALSSIVAGTLFLTGCAGYRLGMENSLPFESIFVDVVANDSFAPQAQALLTQNLRESIARDPRVKLADREEADVTLTVRLSSYTRQPDAAMVGDTALARSFRLNLGALVTLQDNRDARTYLNDWPVETESEAFTDSGLTQAEYREIPLLTEDLSARIREKVLDTW